MIQTNRSAYALKCWLRNNHVTQASFAKRIGVNVSSMSKLVNGKLEPTISLARQIALATHGNVQVEGWAVETAVGEITMQAAE